MDRLDAAVAALTENGWTETFDGGTLAPEDLRFIAQTVYTADPAGDRLAEFAHWLLTLDDPEDPSGRFDRQRVTLTRIIERAREALGEEA